MKLKIATDPKRLKHRLRMAVRRQRYKQMQIAFCRERYPKNHPANSN